MSNSKPSRKTRIRRVPDRGHYDRKTINSIIDEALICHVGFVDEGQPFVIPTIHARDGDRLLFHGAKASRMLKHIGDGNNICVSITMVDGLVLARSVFHHSMNYRSAVLFGTGTVITDEREKMRGFKVLTEHLVPGRWADARRPNRKEINATTLISVPIDEASAKIRTGHPGDDEPDYTLPVWAGTLPLVRVFSDPIPDDRLPEDIPIPDYLKNYERGAGTPGSRS